MQNIEQELEQIKNDLARIEDLVGDNHDMIKRLHRAYRFNLFVSIIKWVLIVGFALGIFYYLQPYLEGVLKLYGSINSITGGVDNTGGINILNTLKDFINQ